MANVLFKQGLQSSLKTIRDNLCAIEGTFYLTTDTHRLYLGDNLLSQAVVRPQLLQKVVLQLKMQLTVMLYR